MTDASLSLGFDDSIVRMGLSAPSIELSLPGFGELSNSATALDRMDSKPGSEVNFSAFNSEISSSTAPVEKKSCLLAEDIEQDVAVVEDTFSKFPKRKGDEDKHSPNFELNWYNDRPHEEHAAFSSLPPRAPVNYTPADSSAKKRMRKEPLAISTVTQKSPDNSKRRNWTEEEVQKFYEGLYKFEADFPSISAYIGTKRADQVSSLFRKEFSRAQHHFKKDGIIVPTQRGAKANLADQVAVLKQWAVERSENTNIAESETRTEGAKLPRKKTSAKHHVQLVPESKNDETILRSHGFNPLVVVVLRGHRPVSDIIEHLTGKWGSLLAPRTDLQLLGDFEATSKIDEVLEQLGNPKVPRLRYELLYDDEPIVGESTLSRLLGNSVTFPTSLLPSGPNGITDDVAEEVVLPFTCEDANDGMEETLADHVTACPSPPRGSAFASIFQ
ncbi:hypothetical protein NDN08_008308 [Rhodosorus marinus]|uniref:Myb-like domain-containing protein n=1 Tax=Rhodosorus marinus TaxID=101924 RepID=A0AAV8V443_9RHOD|nr:hypothetical protein NDN08_008308 [Rhodosorus marinus]